MPRACGSRQPDKVEAKGIAKVEGPPGRSRSLRPGGTTPHRPRHGFFLDSFSPTISRVGFSVPSTGSETLDDDGPTVYHMWPGRPALMVELHGLLAERPIVRCLG